MDSSVNGLTLEHLSSEEDSINRVELKVASNTLNIDTNPTFMVGDVIDLIMHRGKVSVFS